MTSAALSQFQKEDVTISRFTKALGHPARVAILKVLAEREECICGEIVDIVPLAQSTVSQHLRELKKAGLIKGRIFGSKSCYCINWEVFGEFLTLFSAFTGQMETYKPAASCC